MAEKSDFKKSLGLLIALVLLSGAGVSSFVIRTRHSHDWHKRAKADHKSNGSRLAAIAEYRSGPTAPRRALEPGTDKSLDLHRSKAGAETGPGTLSVPRRGTLRPLLLGKRESSTTIEVSKKRELRAALAQALRRLFAVSAD